MDPSPVPLLEAVDRLRDEDPRYAREGYLFVVAALAYAVERLPGSRREDPVLRHLTGAELVRAVVQLGRQEFGPLAPAVFREWGVMAGDDVGAMVFQLIECGQLSARPEDSREDFLHVPELLRALGAGESARQSGSA